MPTTVNIPPGTLKARARPYTVGPKAVPAGAHSFQLTATATQAVGAGNSIVIDVQQTLDGVTWESLVSSPWIGGGDFGGSLPALTLGTDFWVGDPAGEYAADTSRPAVQVQIVVTITGASLVVSGGTLEVT